MAELVAKRYGKALFEYASSHGVIDEIQADAAYLRDVFQQNPGFARYLELPEITAEAKVESIETIFGPKDQREASLSVGMRGLLAILIRKGRISALMPVLEEYGRLVMEFRREVQAHVRTAAALSEDEEQRIQEALCQSLHKKVSLSVEVDGALIGGLVIRVGDTVFDNSIRTRLDRLTRELMDVQLRGEEKAV